MLLVFTHFFGEHIVGLGYSTHRLNHVCQIFSRSVQVLRSSDTPKLPFPIDLLRRPYNSVHTAVRHYDGGETLGSDESVNNLTN